MCTGTGSTSWSFNISKVTPQCVKRVLEIVQTKTGKDVGVDNQKLIDEVEFIIMHLYSCDKFTQKVE